MTVTAQTPAEMANEELARYIVNLFHRIVVHYSFWFTEVRHQMGLEKAFGVMEEATSRGLKIQLNRLAKTLGFEMKDDLPAPLMNLSRESLLELLNSVHYHFLFVG